MIVQIINDGPNDYRPRLATQSTYAWFDSKTKPAVFYPYSSGIEETSVAVNNGVLVVLGLGCRERWDEQIDASNV
jgi:hypothetical protein